MPGALADSARRANEERHAVFAAVRSAVTPLRVARSPDETYGPVQARGRRMQEGWRRFGIDAILSMWEEARVRTSRAPELPCSACADSDGTRSIAKRR